MSTHFVRPRLAHPVRPISTHVDPPNAAFASARAPSRRRLPSSSMFADPPALRLSIKLSRRGTFANPSRICANRELARTCANVRTRRECANLSRIRESVANLSRTRPTRCELVQTRSRTFANPSRICANLRNPGGELSRIRRKSVKPQWEPAKPHAKCASVSLHVTRIVHHKRECNVGAHKAATI